MKLIQAQSNDGEEIFSLIEDSARWIHSMGIQQWPLGWLNKNKDNILKSVDDGLFYSYRIDDKLVAVVELRTSPQEIWELDLAKSIYVQKFAVSRAFKGQGLGKEIMDEIIFTGKRDGHEFIRLDCAYGNTRLRDYYKSLGFKERDAVEYNGFSSALLEFRVLTDNRKT